MITKQLLTKTKAMTKSNKKLHGYKYTIMERLKKMPFDDYQLAWKYLPETLKITRGTFKNWCYFLADDKVEIPGTAILILAAFFECSPIELFTYPMEVEQITMNWEEERRAAKEEEEQIKKYYEER